MATTAPTNKPFSSANFLQPSVALISQDSETFKQGSIIRFCFNDGSYFFYHVNTPFPESDEKRKQLLFHYLNNTKGYCFTEINHLVKDELKTFALFTKETSTPQNKYNYIQLTLIYTAELVTGRLAEHLKPQVQSSHDNPAQFLAALTVYINCFQENAWLAESEISMLRDEVFSLQTIAKGEIPVSFMGCYRVSQLLKRSCDKIEGSQNAHPNFIKFTNIIIRFLVVILKLHQVYSLEHAEEVVECLKGVSKYRIEVASGRGMATAALGKYFKIRAASDITKPKVPWPDVRVYKNGILETMSQYAAGDVLFLLHFPMGHFIDEIVQSKLSVLIYATGRRVLFEGFENVLCQLLLFQRHPVYDDDQVACLIGINMKTEDFKGRVSRIPNKYLKK
ncbi:hypothetical protein [Parashewanella tropica]|uniref:hypothetical protein n=1 Tax=Parashewanella tropica TaxID=2547970 RepID=UPI0010599B8C|nr:hypothetical protein [Parashewanella tropica]